MLFNSLVFLYVFLPITVMGFAFISYKKKGDLAFLWLVVCSLFFYGWWDPKFLILLGSSIIVNFGLGRHLNKSQSKSLLVVGIAFNLGLICYFKYAGFLVQNINAITGTNISLGTIVLPLAISFFTFQQIAYLVDAYQQKVHEYKFIHYCLFVTFFPQLIAGPIVRYGEMAPQFSRKGVFDIRAHNIAIGLTIIAIGLWKKVVLADGIAVYANAVFDAAEAGASLTFVEAWGGALAFSLELYFDFSGYSDMAIGLARLFGIRLPINFNSPYKAANIIDFWRRWHMTLVRFLRDYLYIPLGGNRKGSARRYTNVMVVMLLGGLWHGAGWTFVIWGGIHGVFVLVYYVWHAVRRTLGPGDGEGSLGGRFAGWLLTFTCVVVAWVPFRAESLDTTVTVLSGMAGLNGITLPAMLQSMVPSLAILPVTFGASPYFQSPFSGPMIGALLLVAWLLPNTQEWMARYRPSLARVPVKVGSPLSQGMITFPKPGRIAEVFPLILLVLGGCAILAAVAAPYIGLGLKEEFLFYRLAGWSRSDMFRLGIVSGLAGLVAALLVKIWPWMADKYMRFQAYFTLRAFLWRPLQPIAVAVGAFTAVSLLLVFLSKPHAFQYFQF